MMILEMIFKWAVPFICSAVAGCCVGAVKSLNKKQHALENGMQALLRAEIIRSHEKYIKQGWCPIYAQEALNRAYQAYHNLGGNDVATKLFNEIMELPANLERK